MTTKLIRIMFALAVACTCLSSTQANNLSMDSDTYFYDESTNQITVLISYDFTDFAMFGGGFNLIYDPEALTFVSYTRDLSNSMAQENASPVGFLSEPGFYEDAGIGTFEFFEGLTDAATFGTFVFEVNQPTCTICFMMTPVLPLNPMVSLTGLDVTDEVFSNGITQASIVFPEFEELLLFANECVYLQDGQTDQYVKLTNFRYEVTDLPEEATPFYMQATTFSKYILHGPSARMIATSQQDDRIFPIQTASNRAEWTLSLGFDDDLLRMTNNLNGLDLSVAEDGRLTQVDAMDRRWTFEPATGCTAFPEVEVNVLGTPEPSQDPEAPVRGFIDAHAHITAYEFMGGRLHCGKPWDRYGVPDALADCPDHFASGEYAVMENLLSSGTREGFHLNQEWPIFDPPGIKGWPRYDSLTHEGMYWKAIERSWQSGQRLMVVNLTENGPLCELYWLGDNDCDDRISIINQAQKMRELEAYIDAQYKGFGNGFFRIVESPSEARDVINEGKLAVVLGVESTRPLSCGFSTSSQGQCATSQIESRLDELWDLGVRSMFPVYVVDNLFGGTSMAADFQGTLYNYLNQDSTGGFWKVEDCTTDESDITPPSPGIATQVFPSDPNHQARERLPTSSSTPEPPIYPPGPVCNSRGLTFQGEFLINRMAELGMIIETDHMSAKMRDQVLTILEGLNYSGVATSHGVGGSSSRERIQALGGFVAPHASDTTEFIAAWQEASSTQSPSFQWGIGFGADMNGLRKQAAPRLRADVENPVIYPFDNYDGTTVVDRNIWGSRVWDINRDGVAHYGMVPDWIKDLENVAGPDIINDLANGAEAYLQMWERVYPESPPPNDVVSSKRTR